MTRPSDTRLLVLHGLRLTGFGDSEAVAAVVSIPADQVSGHLDDLHAEELVVYRDGRLTGWALTPAGRAEHERLLAHELDGIGCRDAVVAAYQSFLELNPELLAVRTAWQMRDDVTLNAHDDEQYDRGVIDQLGALDARVAPVLIDLGREFARYQGYRPRFSNALDRVRAGEHDWFAKPTLDSYHTVWFQLHEDLLNTLGIERSKESTAS